MRERSYFERAADIIILFAVLAALIFIPKLAIVYLGWRLVPITIILAEISLIVIYILTGDDNAAFASIFLVIFIMFVVAFLGGPMYDLLESIFLFCKTIIFAFNVSEG